ncbi:MAG: cytochrome c biogenesis protein DipZ [Gaiellaceae bacterium]
MAVLLGIAFLAGVITSISPCVLPVLPIVFAGGASGGRRRPFAIIAGLVASFAAFTLFAAWILDRLGLPKDTLRNVAIGFLFLLAATLILPRLAELLERPFLFLTRRRSGDLGGGFLLGVSLGLVFVPCAGPVLGVITTQAASLDFGIDTVLLTLAYSAGAAIPMLAIAIGGQRATERARFMRRQAARVRPALGVVMALAALAIVFNLDRKAQVAIGDYTLRLQSWTERTSYADRQLEKIRGERRGAALAAGAEQLRDFGRAPELAGISRWLNTPGGRPLTIRGLRGKVVLIDFWTYSCINCLRTLPHLKAWDAAYRKAGLAIVGVHTPEFAFEHEPGNVRRAVAQLGLRYAVALDNGYDTWNAFSNEYWPAKYLIDRRGHVRYAHFGEGEYERTEQVIRRLLGESAAHTRPAAPVRDATPQGRLTPESYLGYSRLDRFSGSPIRQDRMALYRFPPALPLSTLGYAGAWRVEAERIVAGPRARLRLHFRAREVHLVLGGRGTVEVLVDGRRERTVPVAGITRLYTLARFPKLRDALLELRFSRNVEAYAFTFG